MATPSQTLESIPALDAERAREVLNYNPETGELRWRIARKKCSVGALAGHLNALGYIEVRVDRRLYRAHRLAWLIMTGEWPTHEVDHVNVDRADNRWANLRAATHAENMRNVRRRRHNSCGIKGVHRHQASGKWRAQIRINGCMHHIGLFETPEEAGKAYAKAAADLHGEFGRADH